MYTEIDFSLIDTNECFAGTRCWYIQRLMSTLLVECPFRIADSLLSPVSWDIVSCFFEVFVVLNIQIVTVTIVSPDVLMQSRPSASHDSGRIHETKHEPILSFLQRRCDHSF